MYDGVLLWGMIVDFLKCAAFIVVIVALYVIS